MNTIDTPINATASRARSGASFERRNPLDGSIATVAPAASQDGPKVHDEARMPFAGIKRSDWGRFGGRTGIEAFAELRRVKLQTSPRNHPYRPG